MLSQYQPSKDIGKEKEELNRGKGVMGVKKIEMKCMGYLPGIYRVRLHLA